MSYVAEPYAQFVDDLLTSLTGGASRQRFVFLQENRPFQISAPGAVIPRTVRVFGQARQAFFAFRPDVDYELGDGPSITWLERPDGTPAPDAIWPDEGTPFFANFEFVDPAGGLPLLTDRNVGSVTRLFAESFAREYAVLSRQLEAVYRGAYLATATGRDLDAVVKLVGQERRRSTFASGTVIFSRPSPAQADIFVPAGTRLSTSEPPPVVFETTEDATLRRGDLTVSAQISAIEPGSSGVVAGGVIRVIHRPILGITSVSNPQPTRFSGSDESDDALRERARRALEGGGRATTGALVSALTTIPGLREKDIRLSEDHIAHPGVLHLNIAMEGMDEATASRAVGLIEDTRPVGVRVIHNLDGLPVIGESTPGTGEVPDEGEAPVTDAVAGEDDVEFVPITVNATLVPTTLTLTSDERRDLETRAGEVIDAFFDEAGLGTILVYNRLVAGLLSLDGVLDVALELFPESDPGASRRKNVFPKDPNAKPVSGTVTIEIGGRLVLVDVTAAITLKGLGGLGDPATNAAAARDEIETNLRQQVKLLDEDLTPQALLARVGASENYTVDALNYEVNYVEAGVRIRKRDLTVPLTGLERIWIGSVTLAEEPTS
ncbi:MAG TPA: baseplate J/gp47 family protein [Longimicrobiales bacterium]|nr:baseplate J/gp47 family protein [Longimicrobiales bacterium]